MLMKPDDDSLGTSFSTTQVRIPELRSRGNWLFGEPAGRR